MEVWVVWDEEGWFCVGVFNSEKKADDTIKSYQYPQFCKKVKSYLK